MENETEELLPPVKIGITHGDVNGIGYEVILKMLSDARLLEMFTPVVYGSSKVASYYKKTLDLGEINFHIIRSADQALDGKANLINISNKEIRIELGESTEVAGEMAFLALEQAVDDLKHGRIDALVTAPINKKNIQREDFHFPGHTEYLAQRFQTSNSLMLMVGSGIRIGVVTGHIPLREVSSQITSTLIMEKLRVFSQALKRDFNILKPKIAVLGLNPHAGDHGVLGLEEDEVIIPALQDALNEGILAFGPYPADGFFGSSVFTQFDGILAMYHDQGLIPFKTMSFDQGVNYTAGLPFVRTSPAHGTAYNIAGKNEASPTSFREAVYLAIDLARNRKMFDEASADPLRYSLLAEDSDADKNELKNLPDDPGSD